MDESVQVLVEQMTFGLIAFGVDISLFFAWVYIEYRSTPQRNGGSFARDSSSHWGTAPSI